MLSWRYLVENTRFVLFMFEIARKFDTPVSSVTLKPCSCSINDSSNLKKVFVDGRLVTILVS
jgi:hypothetical protein